ncbi:MAG TPA: group 1 truncated hemoglobin [Kofleriaceae bacterium]|nr:group 1 truncated hemoglobin [Kofleriaceae bacterium]
MRARAVLALALALVLALALAGGCWTGSVPEPRAAEPRIAERPSLYVRIGGGGELEAIVDELMDGIEADGRIDMYFMNADGGTIRRRLTEWLCVASRGPCRYTGKPLHEAHAGMPIGDLDFDAFVDVFTRVLHRRGIRGRERIELVLLLRRARADVVETSRSP